MVACCKVIDSLVARIVKIVFRIWKTMYGLLCVMVCLHREESRECEVTGLCLHEGVAAGERVRRCEHCECCGSQLEY